MCGHPLRLELLAKGLNLEPKGAKSRTSVVLRTSWKWLQILAGFLQIHHPLKDEKTGGVDLVVGADEKWSLKG